MRIRLPEPSLTDELADYLRRCECDVTLVQRGLIDVELRRPISIDAALSLVQADRCYGCGEKIEPVLRELGSTLCHDCRGGGRENGHADGPAHATEALRARWARMEIDAYLKVWSAMHADSVLELID
jgi:hypothetical protein